jgi:hypothetical protein
MQPSFVSLEAMPVVEPPVATEIGAGIEVLQGLIHRLATYQ